MKDLEFIGTKMAKNRARLDKIKICGFNIIDISDIDNLVSRGIVTINKEECFNNVELASGKRVQSIIIKDDLLFGYMKYSMTKHLIRRATMEIFVDYSDMHNLLGFSVDDYKRKINMIQDKLLKEYHIIVDFSDATFSYIEINKTIELDYDFDQYGRAISMIMAILPNRLRLNNNAIWSKYVNSVSGAREIVNKTFFRSSGKRGMDVVIYDKSEDLRERCNELVSPDKHYLRLELKLKSGGIIASALGTNLLNELNDEIIENYFVYFIEDNIVDAYKKCEKKRLKYLEKQFMTFDGSPAKKAKELLGHILNDESVNSLSPLILDISDIFTVIDKVHKGKTTNIRQLRSRLKEAFKVEAESKKYNNYFNSKDKFDEIISKLLY